ncbi:DUF2141 domain-containing protein [Nitrosomonas sp.]|uniref:DUF2141 domain-containing protein n=1 Tax=Nitrosomonas sp. TaxID=42353 RepID=UPI001D9F8AE7|nr:DUF2141 domain-containing protein [Nitrosomonas sp.]MCB1947433.1 DUF2141 domain-containing protein [Nitrosomonas sp.]MCP5241861.1 DUF2141 domain-containing protein [Burkholderiales bacterium]MDR4513194.1 DUF2141 domain-containing protein [Nitrosomonas sp.]
MNDHQQKTFLPFLKRAGLGLFTTFMVCFLASPSVIAKEKLDIRPYEAPDPCDPGIAQVRVTVNGVGSGGILSVELYHDPDNFLYKKGRTKRIRIPATESQHKVCFNIEKPGTYAVASYHDIDGNRKLNKKWNMMPKEPFGLSNNPEQHFGFPEFSESAFTTDEFGADITIDLRQP